MEDGGAVRSWCGHAGALVPVGGEDIEERGMSGVAQIIRKSHVGTR